MSIDENWYEFVQNDFNQILTMLGYYNIDTYFSGFWSQGDGACFTANYYYEVGNIQKLKEYAPQEEELHRIARELMLMQKRVSFDLTANISQTGRYSHEMTMRCEVASYQNRVSDDIIAEKCEDTFLDLSRDLAIWYYKRLTKEYEYLMEQEDEDNNAEQ